MRKLITILAFLFCQLAQGQQLFFELNQNKGGYSFSDADAATYIANVEATGATVTDDQKAAIDNYFVGLKSDGLWTKIYDRGLLIWGSSAACNVTMKSACAPTISGSPTYLSSGIFFASPNYINLNVTAATAGATGNTHAAVYSQTNNSLGTAAMGVIGGGTEMYFSFTASAINSGIGTAGSNRVGGTYSALGTLGYFIISRTSSTSIKSYQTGSQIGVNTGSNTGGLPAYNVYVGAYNNVGGGTAAGYFGRTISLWSIGNGFTDTDAANDNTRTETLMDALGIGVQ